jgi:hypothetical protein
LAEHIKAEMVISDRKRSLPDDSPLPVNLRKIWEEHRLVSGIREICGKVYDQAGFHRIFSRCPVSRSVMKDIVPARLCRPCSKRASVELLERDFGIKLPLEKVCRMMDTLSDERIKKLQDISWDYS